jgi:hypothetical protein
LTVLYGFNSALDSEGLQGIKLQIQRVRGYRVQGGGI